MQVRSFLTLSALSAIALAANSMFKYTKIVIG